MTNRQEERIGRFSIDRTLLGAKGTENGEHVWQLSGGLSLCRCLEVVEQTLSDDGFGLISALRLTGVVFRNTTDNSYRYEIKTLRWCRDCCSRDEQYTKRFIHGERLFISVPPPRAAVAD